MAKSNNENKTKGVRGRPEKDTPFRRFFYERNTDMDLICQKIGISARTMAHRMNDPMSFKADELQLMAEFYAESTDFMLNLVMEPAKEETE